MEKIKSIKRMDWRQKVLLSILGSFLVIMSLLFYITYYYFVNKVEEGNEEVVLITFEQAEKDLENILKDAELCLDKYMTDDLVWKFVHEYPKVEAKRSRLKVGITDEFTNEMSVNREISSLGILCSDGFGIMSSSSRKNRTGYTVLSEKLQKILAYSKENYPYTTWLPGWELELEESSPFSVMLQNSGLVGIKAMGESEALDEESFLFVSIDESNIQNTYNAVAFNDSVAVLVDENDRIISNVGEEKLGEKYAPGEDTQNIEYPLGLYGWRLCNMIPKADYMKDANDIRNFGLAIILIAILATAIVAVIWSRKYTQPIELLMENMHRVKRQEFDIEKPEHLGWEELDLLNEELFETAQSIKDYIERLKQAEQEKAKEELLALQYQMNPHFLLNSLNSIRWMAMMTNNKVVADTLVTLSKIITPVLRNPSLTWKLENEIEFLENYVSMMQLRYGHDMEYQLDCAKELYDIEFPRLILQPLIENCFVHGSTPGEMRTIHILIQCRKDIEVTIVNSGVFFEEEELDKIREKMRAKTKASDHIGLANVCKRLNLLYQEKGVMRITSNREIGFIVQIRFPQHVQM